MPERMTLDAAASAVVPYLVWILKLLRKFLIIRKRSVANSNENCGILDCVIRNLTSKDVLRTTKTARQGNF